MLKKYHLLILQGLMSFLCISFCAVLSCHIFECTSNLPPLPLSYTFLFFICTTHSALTPPLTPLKPILSIHLIFVSILAVVRDGKSETERQAELSDSARRRPMESTGERETEMEKSGSLTVRDNHKTGRQTGIKSLCFSCKINTVVG